MTHYQGEEQWAYNDWLAKSAGPDVQPLPAWRAQMYGTVGKWKRAHPQDYRDTWTDPETEAAAEETIKEFSGAAPLAHRVMLLVLIMTVASRHWG
jgi:hypothetical protein